MRKVTRKRGQRANAGSARRDRGSSGVEMIVALASIGVMASITTVMVTGMTSEAAESSCLSEAKALATATVSYMTVGELSSIPPTVTSDTADHDRYEMTLVRSGFLRQPSSLYDITPAGAIVPTEDSSC